MGLFSAGSGSDNKQVRNVERGEECIVNIFFFPKLKKNNNKSRGQQGVYCKKKTNGSGRGRTVGRGKSILLLLPLFLPVTLVHFPPSFLILSPLDRGGHDCVGTASTSSPFIPSLPNPRFLYARSQDRSECRWRHLSRKKGGGGAGTEGGA
jgi:hypothetical protein